MKLKQIIAALLAVSVTPVFGAEPEVTETAEVVEAVMDVQSVDKFHMFKALGIITGYESEDVFFDIPYVSRGEYCSMMSLLLADEIPAGGNSPFIDVAENKDKDAVAYLYGLGYVSGVSSEEFKPELAITVEQAVIIASRILGYDYFIKNFPDTSYADIAHQYKLLENLPGDMKEALTKTQLLTLLENIIEAEPFGIEIGGEKQPAYGVYKDGTVLGFARDIYKAEGVMTESVYTDELGIKYAEPGTVVVGDVEYWDDSYQDKTGFLGKYVDVYYKEENQERTALYVIADEWKTEELVLNSEMIVGPVTSEYVTYEFGTRTKKAKLSRALKVVYNGVAYPDYTIDELKPDYGKLKLIDNNRDEEYDYAIVTSYDIMWFDRYSPLEKKYYNKFGKGISEILVDDPQIERNLYIEVDGEKVDRFGVSTGNVLLIEQSKGNDDKLIKIYGSTAKKEGVVTANRENDYGEREIIIDGESYLMNPGTAALCENGEVSLPKIELGKSYVFYLDATGRIGAFEKSAYSAELYGYAKKFARNDDDETYSVKVFTENDEWKQYYFADKLYVNGEFVKSDAAYNILAPGGITSPTMIKFKITDGVIKSISTPVQSDEYRSDVFTTSGLKEFMYVGTTKNLGDRYFFNSDGKIFVIPTNSSADESDYHIYGSGILRTETVRYNMEVYDADEFGHSSIFKLETNNGSTDSIKYPYHIVKQVSQALDENGEVVGMITCCADGEDDVKYYAKKADTFEGLSKGDIIQIETDNNGRVISVLSVYDSSMEGTYYDDGQPDMYNVSIDIRGYVMDIDVARYVLKMNLGANQFYIKSNSAPNVALVKGDDVKVGTFNDIKPGDYIVGRVGYGQMSDVVIIRN